MHHTINIKSWLFVLLITGYAFSRPREAERKYYGAKLIRITPKDSRELHYLQGIEFGGKCDFWTQPRMAGKPVDVMVTRWWFPWLKETLETARIEYEVIMSDVLSVIHKHREENERARAIAAKHGRELEWTAYHEYDEIMEWVDSLATTYPSLVTVEDVGISYERRTMKIVKVSTGGSGKPAIFSDAGIHAREWIAPATLTYIMNELLSNSESYSDVLDAVDFYFMPSINPDGYSYTWSDDRLWRKTRSIIEGERCIGVDPNRNWDFHWMEAGASQVSCTETYAGPEPFSEPETVIVRDQMLGYENIEVYLTFHSYSQVMIYPWGYDEVLPDDWEDLDALANDAVDALTAVHGTRYDVGSSGILLYPAAGASDDYAKGVADIKYSYTIELRDTGEYGFELPPEQIIPTGEETFAAFEVVMNFVRDTYGVKK